MLLAVVQRLMATEASASHAIRLVTNTSCQCFRVQVFNGIHQQIEQQRATIRSNTASMSGMRNEVSAMDREVRSLNSR